MATTIRSTIRSTPPPTPIVIAAHKGSVVVDSVVISWLSSGVNKY